MRLPDPKLLCDPDERPAVMAGLFYGQFIRPTLGIERQRTNNLYVGLRGKTRACVAKAML